SVAASDARFGFARLPGFEHLQPTVTQPGNVVGVNEREPLPAQRLFQRRARIVQPAPIEIVDKAARPCAPSESWDQVECSLRFSRETRCTGVERLSAETRRL